MHQATPDVGGKPLSCETVLPEPADTSAKEAALPFMEHLLAGHPITRATEDMDGTIDESYSDPNGHKSQPHSSSVDKPYWLLRGARPRASCQISVS